MKMSFSLFPIRAQSNQKHSYLYQPKPGQSGLSAHLPGVHTRLKDILFILYVYVGVLLLLLLFTAELGIIFLIYFFRNRQSMILTDYTLSNCRCNFGVIVCVFIVSRRTRTYQLSITGCQCLCHRCTYCWINESRVYDFSGRSMFCKPQSWNNKLISRCVSILIWTLEYEMHPCFLHLPYAISLMRVR